MIRSEPRKKHNGGSRVQPKQHVPTKKRPYKQHLDPTTHRFSHTGTPASFSLMYAGRFIQSSDSAGSFTYHGPSAADSQQAPREARRRSAQNPTFIMYDCGAITLETRGLRANPY